MQWSDVFPAIICGMDERSWVVRDASRPDAAACAASYAPWLVLEVDGRVVEYAYGGPFKARAAYRWSCEVSVYLERGRRRTGGGRMLCERLLTRLAERGFRTFVAGMTLPNEASVGLHRAPGFEPVGTYRGIGWKHDAWHDVAWVQRPIGSGTLTEPRSP